MDTETLYPILKSVHIFSMRTGFSLLVLSGLLLAGGAYLPFAPRLIRWSSRAERISFALRAVGLFAGIGTAITGGWSLVAPWLLLAYLLISLHFALDGRLLKPWHRRLQALTASPDGVVVTEIQRVLRERRALVGQGLVLLVFIGIFLTMRLKPSFGVVTSASPADITQAAETVAIPTASTQTDVVYTVQTMMGGSPGLAFVGVGGEIEGMVNPTLTAVVGDVVTITLVNGHGMPHDLTIEGLGVATEPLSSAGQQSTIRFTVTESGDYVYYCSIPGHREAGMSGILRVSAS